MGLILSKDNIIKIESETPLRSLLRVLVDHQKNQDKNIEQIIVQIEKSIKAMGLFQSNLSKLSGVEIENRKALILLQNQISQALNASVLAVREIKNEGDKKHGFLISSFDEIINKLDHSDITKSIKDLTKKVNNNHESTYKFTINRDHNNRISTIDVKEVKIKTVKAKSIV